VFSASESEFIVDGTVKINSESRWSVIRLLWIFPHGSDAAGFS